MNVLVNSWNVLLATMARWVPQFLGALILLFIGYLVAKTLERLVALALRKAGFDALVHRGTAGSYIERIVSKPSALLGSIVFWLIWVGALSLAVSVLGIPALTAFVASIYSYLPNIIAALVIFFAAGAVSAGAVALVNRLMGDTPTGKLVEAVVPAIVMLIAVFMILNQLGFAKEIVNITYSALVGSVALAMALAFGLGGRTVAARLLEQAYENGQKGVHRAKADVQVAKARAHDDIS